MVTLDHHSVGSIRLDKVARRLRQLWRRGLGFAADGLMPKGLYARTLLIIITPIVLLESVVAFVFMERHWESVTRRLSESTAGDIGAVVEMFDNYRSLDDYRGLTGLADRRFRLSLQVRPNEELPTAKSKPFFDLLDRTLSTEIRKQIEYPFWIDTLGASRFVEVRIKIKGSVLRIQAPRSQTYASNSHIFLLWMVGTSLVLLTVAILFLRNQIRPILRLANAASDFGKGRGVPADFRPRGAKEVRDAAMAFIEMRDRIEKHVEQRTTMLAGVSHDLRTVLTRFKLQLAMLPETADTEAMRWDVDEMQLMLEDYMAFARGGSGEAAIPVDVFEMIEEVREEAERYGKKLSVKMRRRRKAPVELRRHAFKRTVGNLVSNAARYAETVVVTVRQDRHWLTIDVDDDGPGIPPEKRDIVFRPFFRLEEGRNQDRGNTGLGLAIARDIARVHGGDITLETSPLGGLRAIVRVPV